MALLGLLAVAVMVFAYVLTSRLNAASQFVGIDRDDNARVLAQAKRALIGWMAINAVGTDSNPGRLPCPQAWADVGSANEGRAAPSCSVPAAGWLPWRTLGLEKPLDASGIQIWYVISPGWHLPSVSATLTINSGTPGQLALDGQAAVALLIAPGSPLAIAPNANQLAAGCTARNQSQVLALPGTPPDPLDFLDCQNGSTADNVFVASVVDNATNLVFNDQVLAVTPADVLPALEAAIAHRIEREIAPALRGVYASSAWGPTISSSNPVFPYPAPFADPGSSPYQGAAVTVAGAPQGLLPFNQTQGCNPATDVRCTTTLTAWASPAPAPPPDVTKIGGYGSFQTKTCSWQSSNNVAFCEGEYREDSSNTAGSGMVISMTATINNVAMGLRVLDTTKATIEAENNVSGGAPLTIVTPSIAATMNSIGSVTITFSGTLPNIDVQGWGTYANYRIRLERSVIGDHALLDPTNGTSGWFVRNEWYRLLYYATVDGHTAGALPAAPSCTTTVTCLSVANGDPTRPITPAGGQRAILLFAGSGVAGQTRPSATRGDYFEFGNATGAFERQPVKKSPVVDAALKVPFNDRIIVVGSN
jgi:hypothetical protein